jgi:L-threonylcarbamoyladenylate synthase
MMKTEYLIRPDPQTVEGQTAIRHAGEIIRAGGLVVFPTETVYGIGADATNADAARAIYRAKGRPADNPLIIHLADPDDAERYTYTVPLYRELAKRFLPGPLTVILRARESIPKAVTAGLDTVAVRCPSHPLARALIRSAGVPIAAPSANLSGSPSPTRFDHVRKDMDGRVDMIIDGGECEIGVESTIVKLEDDGSLLLLRPGRITPEELSEVTDRISIAAAVTEQLKPDETVLSPGMKYRHYAPEAPVYLLKGDDNARQKYLSAEFGNYAVLCYSEEMESYRLLPGKPALYDIGSAADPAVQLHRLFRILREVDAENYERIYAPLPSTEGLSLALYNRMIRAAAYQIIEV